MQFMSSVYGLNETEHRKLSFLYKQSGIATRYSVIADYNLPESDWNFIPAGNGLEFPTLEQRMRMFESEAPALSIQAIKNCLEGFAEPAAITHLVTVSCTGMSAPGLDLQIMETLRLSPNIFRTSVNFMGCYAAVHALKLARLICDASPEALVLIVDTELCTLHFQQKYTPDNAASSLLFSDGSAAVLVSGKKGNGLSIDGFYSQVAFRGKSDMSWQLGSKGFLMQLSGYVPQLVQEDIMQLVSAALQYHGRTKSEITHWCIHPGGKKILDAIQQRLDLSPDDLCFSRSVLSRYGNMSSPTILFVLKDMLQQLQQGATIFGVAFGPGLTMETFLASKQ